MSSENTGLRGPLQGQNLTFDCPHDGEPSYTVAGGISLASTDFAPTSMMTGFLCTDNAGSAAAGNIMVEMAGGGEMPIPMSVPVGAYDAVRFMVIKKILKTGTTFTGKIYPLY